MSYTSNAHSEANAALPGRTCVATLSNHHVRSRIYFPAWLTSRVFVVRSPLADGIVPSPPDYVFTRQVSGEYHQPCLRILIVLFLEHISACGGCEATVVAAAYQESPVGRDT